MNENIDWFEVVFEYSKRFPTRKVKDLGLEFYGNIGNTEFKDLIDDTKGWLIPNKPRVTTGVFSKLGGSFAFNGIKDFKPVTNNVLLRLLTDGKEDLI